MGAALALCTGLPQAGAAQQADLYLGPGRLSQFPLPRAEVSVLTLDRERLFAASAFGQRVARELAVASDTLAAENRRIEADLIGEERMLTERRAEVPPEEFRALADAFDAKVVALRRAQDAKARALQRREEAERQAFFEAVLPVLAEVMADLGGAVILDDRAVFLSSGQIDMTDAAIARVDAAIGDGAGLAPPVAPPDAPGSGADEGAPGPVDRGGPGVD